MNACDEEGFTIIEVLVAAFILVLGSLAIFMTFAAAIHNVHRSQQTQASISVAQRELEKIRAMDYVTIGMERRLTVQADQELPESRIQGIKFNVDRAANSADGEFKPMILGSIPTFSTRVGSPEGTLMSVYRFVLCEEDVVEPEPCHAKRIVIDVRPEPQPNEGGRRPNYYELQSTIVEPQGGEL